MSDEINEGPEFDAKALIEEAFEGVENEDCPMGDECPVHHRLDEAYFDEDERYGRIISYVGEYAVITTDNPEMENPYVALGVLLGKIKPEDLPPYYETCVIKVGAEGTLHDVAQLDQDGHRDAIRFLQLHNSWENFKNAHEAVRSAVVEGLLDLSQPVSKEK